VARSEFEATANLGNARAGAAFRKKTKPQQEFDERSLRVTQQAILAMFGSVPVLFSDTTARFLDTFPGPRKENCRPERSERQGRIAGNFDAYSGNGISR
jgi:hypothetical protein